MFFLGGVLTLNFYVESNLLISYGIFCLFFIGNGFCKYNFIAFLIFAFIYVVLLFIFGATDYSFEACFYVNALI